MSDSRKNAFLDFCCEALGTQRNAPLQGQAGATIGAIVEAFTKIHPMKEDSPRSLQEFEDPIYSEPFVCYVIRNFANGSAYVGIASGGFLSRYPKGMWWKDHHNERLMRDALVFGLANFRVHLYVCTDEIEMRRRETELIRSHRLFTYNLKNEPDNA